MSVQRSYDTWSESYDAMENKTRDLEAIACRRILSGISFKTVIEIGCGTGKNTEWLAANAAYVTAVDLSPEMLSVARGKIKTENVGFKIADIQKPWKFTDSKADLITCSLILEHVEDIGTVFNQASTHLTPNGHFYVCELHPFKQYGGTKARFETTDGVQIVECYTHNISEYFRAAAAANLSLVNFDEWFDGDDRRSIPRLVSFLLRQNKKAA